MSSDPPLRPPGRPAGPAGQELLAWTTRVGGGLLLVGLVAAVLVVGLPLLGRPAPAGWVYGLTWFAPLGFGTVLVGLWGVARARRRDAGQR